MLLYWPDYRGSVRSERYGPLRGRRTSGREYRHNLGDHCRPLPIILRVKLQAERGVEFSGSQKTSAVSWCWKHGGPRGIKLPARGLEILVWNSITYFTRSDRADGCLC